MLIRKNKKQRIISLSKKFIADESGATSIEYGLIAALISIVFIPTIFWMAKWANWKFFEMVTWRFAWGVAY